MGLRLVRRKGGATPGATRYAYTATRVRAKRAKLLPKEMYPKMLNMSVTEIARLLQESEYKREIDELATRYAGIDLIEMALNANLANTYRTLIKISQAGAREVVVAYLRRYDTENIKTILRGKISQAPQQAVEEALVPAGQLPVDMLRRMILGDLQEAVAALEGTPYFDRVKEIGSKPLHTVEDSLDRLYYQDLIKATQGTDIPVVLVNRLVRMEIDVQNLDSLLRLKRDEADPAAILEHVMPGGYEISRGDLSRLASLSWNELVAALEKYSYYESIRERLAAVREGETLRDVETALFKRLSDQAFTFSAAYPLSVLPIMGYIFSKRIEVENIRMIVRGKTAGLSDEVIQRQLVL
jgi:V/A-type H+/Na+-transporting ATPase subunit C